MKLPASGRSGRPPRWPLTGQTVREAELWRREWSRPQAVMWERNGQEVEVALYVRRLTQAEADDASVGVGTLVRQMQEALGLSVPGLLRNRWVIVADEVAPRREERQQEVRPSARDRLKAINGGGA